MYLSASQRLAAIEVSGVRALAHQRRLELRCQAVCERVGADAAQVNVVTGVAQIHVAAWPGRRHRAVPLSQSGCVNVVKAGRTLCIPDVSRVWPFVRGWGGYLGSPIFFDDEIIGTICVLSKKPRDWDPADEDVVENTAAEISAALARHQ